MGSYVGSFSGFGDRVFCLCPNTQNLLYFGNNIVPKQTPNKFGEAGAARKAIS